MRESKVETYFNQQVRAHGGLVRKLKWGNQRNAPDRFVALFGRVWLVEVKRPGETPTKAQERELKRLRAAGVLATWVNSPQMVDEFVRRAKPSKLDITEYADLPDGSVVAIHPSIPPHRWDTVKKAYLPIEFTPVGTLTGVWGGKVNIIA